MFDAQRYIENRVLSLPLHELTTGHELRTLAGILQNHDHLREVLMSETDRKERYEKFHAMRPYVRFQVHPLDWYEMQECMRAYGVMPEHKVPSYITNVYNGTFDPRNVRED